MMNRTDTLLRLKRFRVDEMKRRIASIDAMKADLERKLTDLDDNVAREKQRAGQIEARQACGPIQPGIQQHPVDDIPHEQRLHHLQARGRQCQAQQCGGRIAIGPQPAQIFAKVLARLAWRLTLGFQSRRIVHTPALVILNEGLIALA